MQLSAHFSLDELTFSQEAVRRGIDNTPDANVLANLQMLAAGLERVRSLLGYPVDVSSGYRCPKLNTAIGGSRNSQHIQGLAADFTSRLYGHPFDICKLIEENKYQVGFDQLIYEGRWVHISFADTPRLEVLTARFANGGVAYTKGLHL